MRFPGWWVGQVVQMWDSDALWIVIHVSPSGNVLAGRLTDPTREWR